MTEQNGTKMQRKMKCNTTQHKAQHLFANQVLGYRVDVSTGVIVTYTCSDVVGIILFNKNTCMHKQVDQSYLQLETSEEHCCDSRKF